MEALVLAQPEQLLSRENEIARLKLLSAQLQRMQFGRKSDTTAAIGYVLSRWDARVRYADDGDVEIDNNAAERALRAVALGRKNYRFAG